AWDEVAASGHERFRGGIDVIIGDAAFLADAASRAVGAGAARADRPMSLLIGADAHDGRAQEAMPMPVDAYLSLACRGQELVDVIVRLVDGCRAMRPPAARAGSDNALVATPAPGSRDTVRSESGPMGPRRFEGVDLHAPRAFGQAIPGRHDAAGAPPRGGLPPGALRRVRETMESRLTDKLRLRELAAVAGVSEYHFARAFKQSVGHPPHQYLMMRRIAVAAELVKATDRALIDISLETGFSDQSHFSRMFARITGETPRAYRRRHR
ncbi:MAG: AraC family transcriptional regulator, partial [Betaproteobacteria bacterium]